MQLNRYTSIFIQTQDIPLKSIDCIPHLRVRDFFSLLSPLSTTVTSSGSSRQSRLPQNFKWRHRLLPPPLHRARVRLTTTPATPLTHHHNAPPIDRPAPSLFPPLFRRIPTPVPKFHLFYLSFHLKLVRTQPPL